MRENLRYEIYIIRTTGNPMNGDRNRTNNILRNLMVLKSADQRNQGLNNLMVERHRLEFFISYSPIVQTFLVRFLST